MGFKWGESADQVSEKVAAGVHRLKVASIKLGSKNGPFRSSKGDPQILIVFEDNRGAEASQMFTLSPKAAWTLAVLMSRSGANLKALESDGIEPKHFANQAIADQHLLGLKTWARVTWEEGDGGKRYSRIEPLTEEEAGQEVAAAAPRHRAPSQAAPPDPFVDGAVPEDDDIPFDRTLSAF